MYASSYYVFSYSYRPEGLIAAERVLRQHIGTLDCMVSFEQKALLQYLPTRDGGAKTVSIERVSDH